METEFDEVLKARPDLTIADIYDMIDIMNKEDSLLEAANKFYPVNQKVGECGTI